MRLFKLWCSIIFMQLLSALFGGALYFAYGESWPLRATLVTILSGLGLVGYSYLWYRIYGRILIVGRRYDDLYSLRMKDPQRIRRWLKRQIAEYWVTMFFFAYICGAYAIAIMYWRMYGAGIFMVIVSFVFYLVVMVHWQRKYRHGIGLISGDKEVRWFVNHFEEASEELSHRLQEYIDTKRLP